MSQATGIPNSAVLDFLRGVAAFYVVVNHTRGMFFAGGREVVAQAGANGLSIVDYGALAALQATSLGQEFVIMFFCISGMAMAHSIATSGGGGAFYVRRLVRLWPTYLTAILFAVGCCITAAWLAPRWSMCAEALCNPVRLVEMATYVSVSSPLTPQFWSLPYEVLFYLVCPVLLLTKARVLMVLGAAVLLAVAGALVFGLAINPSGVVVVDFLINALLWFMLGAVGYHWFDRIPKIPGWALLATAVVMVATIYAVKNLLDGSNLFSNALMVVLTLLLVRNTPDRLATVKALNWGHFSYSLYVFHYAVVVVLAAAFERLTGHSSTSITSYAAWLLPLPAIVFFCWLMYFVAEQPSTRALRSLRRVASA